MTQSRPMSAEGSADFAQSPRLPADHKGPVFAEPWHAQAFAMAVSLHAAGVFSWTDWAETLSQKIASDPENSAEPALNTDTNPTDWNERYYQHWLAALEHLLTARGVADQDQITAMADAWRAAYLRTPHGEPVSLNEEKSVPIDPLF